MSMREALIDAAVSALTFGVEVLLMTVLTFVGVSAEVAGLERLATGVDPAAIWLVFVGSLAIYAGVYVIGAQRVAPRLFARVRVENRG